MDVPFHSSGAMSRAHYAIVRKVESSPSVEIADQHIFLEINSVHAQISHPRLSLAKCKECLIILLYCATSVTPGFLAADAFDFAFHHAINLAESEKKVEDKRIGYLFCSEMMPLDHELRLMLINTLRKDLESSDVPHICLALDNLITSPTEDIIPAVQSRLHDLLSHDYSHVRRRALLAFRALASYNPDLLQRIHGAVLRRIKDSDRSVVEAALMLSRSFPDNQAVIAAVNGLLVTEASYTDEIDQHIILAILKSMKFLKLSTSNIHFLLDILQEHSSQKNPSAITKALILEIFNTFSTLDSNAFLSAERLSKISSVQSIRHLLSSYNPNDLYLFIRCLASVDVAAWAGTTSEQPAVLDGPEFERIMHLLNSPDQGTRKETLRVINKIDTSIIEGHIISLLKRTKLEQAAFDINMASPRILEARLIQFKDDGGEYARQVLELIRNMDETTKSLQVFKGIIETVLTDIRIPSNPDFLPSCSTHFVTVLSEPEVSLGPTGVVIATALATEFSDILPTSPLQVLSGLAARLKTCPAIVQEPCIIGMIRLRANCDEVPSDVLDIINAMSQTARRSIRFRCAQFLEFTQNKELLAKIVREAASPSLPDFLHSLQNYKSDLPRSPTSTLQFSRVSSRASGGPSSPSKLKYDAYAPPEALPPLRMRRSSNSQQNLAASRAELSLDLSSHYGSKSPPMNAGQLTLAAGIEDLQIQSSSAQQSSAIMEESTDPMLQVSRSDLITLQSPFKEDLKSLDSSETAENNHDFESTWNSFGQSCDLRGWCSASIDAITRRLQRVERRYLRVMSADLPPFVGELKILMVHHEDPVGSNVIALRLRESEDDSCLWRLRCADAGLGTQIQSILNAQEQ